MTDIRITDKWLARVAPANVHREGCELEDGDERCSCALQTQYWDSYTRGFGVVVGRTGRKTFVARRRVNGTLHKETIGVLGEPNTEGFPITAAWAKGEAEKVVGRWLNGDATPRSRSRAKEGPTLREALEYHVGKMERGERRKGTPCSPRSIYTLRNTIETHIGEYLDRPLLDLTADVLDDMRTSIQKNAERVAGSNPKNPPGLAVSNRLFANVSAIWRSWDKRHGIATTCPVQRFTLPKVNPRENRIGNAELANWHAKVLAMDNGVRRDMQLVALFTGVRTDGVRNLRWDDVDYTRELLHIQRAKGDKPYTVPMTKSVRKVLEQRERENVPLMDPLGGDHGYVFPSLARDGKTVQPVAEVKERRMVRDKDGKPLRDEGGGYVRESYLPGLQACRKTFNSVAIDVGVPKEIRERLMNHEGRGVNVRSYGFPEDWSNARTWADRIEAALRGHIKGKRDVKPVKSKAPRKAVRRAA